MLKKILKVIVLVGAVGFIILQFIRPDFSNPPVVESETLVATAQVPDDVRSILARSCNDCHSNTTVYPWYSYVTPFNYFLAGHIEDGRRELNFSRWDAYSKEKKVRKLEEICEQVEHGAMPLPSYLWIHRSAALSESDSRALCSWSEAERKRLSN